MMGTPPYPCGCSSDSHCKKFLSYTEMKHTLVQHVPIAHFLLHVKRETVFFVAALLSTGILQQDPSQAFSSPGEKT